MSDDDPEAPGPGAGALDRAVVDLVQLVATPPERTLLAALRAEGPLPEPRLVAAAAGPPARVRQALSGLSERGLVRPADGPGSTYALTEAGAALGPVLDAVDDLRGRCGGDP